MSLDIKLLFFIFPIIIFSININAKVTGPCSQCHIMHNSQNGSAVVNGGPYKELTRGNCISCHTGTNDGTNKIPYILDTTEPTYNFDGPKNTLAGGNFYWVKQGDDSTGHNVAGIAPPDSNIGLTPPGWDPGSYTANGQVANGEANWSQQLTCAGTYGCHGKHDTTDQYAAIYGAHHADDSVIDGSTVGKSFRFLYGIKGTEDPKWEYDATSSQHNGYYAVDRNSIPDKSSINYLCAECHGNFHSSSIGLASPWLRHPTDFDMNNVATKEYGNYPNASYFSSVSSLHEYFVDVPVGNIDGAVKSTVLQSSGDAIVLCISCHRGHGSPYKYDLRWNYVNWPNGSDKNGCFACHSAKE